MWKYLQLNKDNIRDKDIIIGGDFNSNKIWDVWDRWWNHSDVFNELKELGIKAQGELLFPEEKKRIKVVLTSDLEKKIEKSPTLQLPKYQ